MAGALCPLIWGRDVTKGRKPAWHLITGREGGWLLMSSPRARAQGEGWRVDSALLLGGGREGATGPGVRVGAGTLLGTPVLHLMAAQGV